MKNHAGQDLPTRTQALLFRGKATLLQVRRAARNLLDGELERFAFGENLKNENVFTESKTTLWTERDPREKFLTAGKIHNLRLAVKKLNGLEIPAGKVFSFWEHVGKTTRRRGFVAGRELREGCIIPNIGGGLCQLSNALYDAALKSNFEIVERHAHTQTVAGSLAESGRDATVFWNYVDLRFKSAHNFRIEAELNRENLTVRFRSDRRNKNRLVRSAKSEAQRFDSAHPQSCATCGAGDCFRAVNPASEAIDFGRAAFLLDEYTPEFDAYIQAQRTANDLLFIPLDGRRLRKPNYAWTTAGFARARQSFFVAAERSFKSRRLAAQGAARQNNLLAMSEKLARDYAKKLSFDVLHLVVQQNLLPFLWREGVLGGRTFDVLMTSLPIKDLQARLDYAQSLHPESSTLGDFRADERLVDAETEALKHTRRIITAHGAIASLFPQKSVRLNWNLPVAPKDRKQKTEDQKPLIVFPAATAGRKGAYELRDAVRGLDVRLLILGANVESENFWEDFETAGGANGDDWLSAADLVVLPAFVEHRPRRLLRAIAAGVPVVASPACGLENFKNVTIVEAGDAANLRGEILKILSVEQAFQKNIAHVAKSSEIFSK